MHCISLEHSVARALMAGDCTVACVPFHDRARDQFILVDDGTHIVGVALVDWILPVDQALTAAGALAISDELEHLDNSTDARVWRFSNVEPFDEPVKHPMRTRQRLYWVDEAKVPELV